VIQEALKSIDYSTCNEWALALFFVVFVGVAARTLFADRRTMQCHAASALQDGEENST
jgi:hypothetical protein